MEIEEKFFRPKSREQVLAEAIECLEETRFNFASFVDHFKRWIELDKDFKEWKKEK